jgi:hypothetical protein
MHSFRLCSERAATFPIPLRTRTLALCLSAALATPALLRNADAAPPTHWTVKNCSDGATDSLRDIIENPQKAQSGDTVDLDQLPALCNMVDSTITLGSEITVNQESLTLQGPTNGSVTISGAGLSRVFHHTGTGVFALNALTISDGYYHPAAASAYGGCIKSEGDLFLSHVLVSHCTAASDGGWAKGGGVHAMNVTLIASKISGNQAKDSGIPSLGGGIYSRFGTLAEYSEISTNKASNGTFDGQGGGLAARSGATLIASTVENNLAGDGGGITVDGGPTLILNSTISGNQSTTGVGSAINAAYALTIANSTIAFNHQGNASEMGAIHFAGAPGNDVLTLQSSIIADNTSGVASTPADIYIVPASGSLMGADNLVIASNVFDPSVITVTSDPKLGPLRFNGGRTRTHMLLPGSPALGEGNTTGLPQTFSTNDQRGVGYPRTTGVGASIDIGAVQFDSIFADSFDW